MRERHRNYELMFIISPMVNAEEDVAAIISRVEETITALEGEVTSVDHSAPWGRRKLAYPIRKYAEGEASRRSFTEGHYVMCYFNLGTTGLPELERSLKLNDLILRHLLLVIEEKKKRVSVSAGAADDAPDADDSDADEADEADEDAETDDDEADENAETDTDSDETDDETVS